MLTSISTRLCAVLLTSLCAGSLVAQEDDKTVRVFLFAGQSNMVGASAFDGGAGFAAGTQQFGQSGGGLDQLIPATVPLDHPSAGAGTFGPWLQFAIDQGAAAPDTGLVLVPAAASGSTAGTPSSPMHQA